MPKRSEKPSGTQEPELGRALARWLRQALQGPDGRQRMTKQEVIEAAGIGRTGFYAVWNGRGGEVLQETLQKLAAALEVPPPRIERVMRLDESNAVFAVPALSTLKEAHAMLGTVIRALEAEQATPAATPDAAAVAAAARDHRHVARLGPAARQPKRPKGHTG